MTPTTISAVPRTSSSVTAAQEVQVMLSATRLGRMPRLTRPDEPLGKEKVEDKRRGSERRDPV